MIKDLQFDWKTRESSSATPSPYFRSIQPHLGGSWWGLPDLGITETIQGIFFPHKALAASNGSNLWGPSDGGQTPSQINNQPTQPPAQQPTPNPTPAPQPPSNNSGGSRLLTGEQLRAMGLNPDQYVSINGLYDINNLQGGGQTTDQARQAEEARIRGIIESGFSEYENKLRNLIPLYNKYRQDEVGNLTKGYEAIFNALQSAKETGLKNLDVSRQQVRQNRESSIEDIQKNMRDVIRASQMNLGAMGAGDSSASEVMAPYAFTKLAGEQAGSVYRQANQQLFEIQKQENDTKNLYVQLHTQAEQDKQNKIAEVESKYNALIAELEDRMARLPAEKAQALAQLAQGFAAQRIAELSQIDAEDRAIKQRINEWATNRMAQLNDYKLQLLQTAKFDPRALVYQELTPFGNVVGSRDSDGFYNPMLLKKKKQE